MKRLTLIKWIGTIILLFICGVCARGYWQFSKIQASLPPVTPTKTPEQIFLSRVLDGQLVPPKELKVQAIEGSMAFGYGSTPAYVRFEAIDSFVTEIIERDYGFYGAYTPMPCANSPITDDLIASERWQPSKVTSPVCYSTSTCILYDVKYLLIDPDNNVGYFYRTAICGLCPSGEEGQALSESPRCQKYQP